MPPSSQITVTIEGPFGGLSSQFADRIADALLGAGFPVKPDPSHGRVLPPRDRLFLINMPTIRIVEKQDAPEKQDTKSVAALEIVIDTSQVKTATDDVAKLTEAAEKAATTLKQLGESLRGTVA